MRQDDDCRLVYDFSIHFLVNGADIFRVGVSDLNQHVGVTRLFRRTPACEMATAKFVAHEIVDRLIPKQRVTKPRNGFCGRVTYASQLGLRKVPAPTLDLLSVNAFIHAIWIAEARRAINLHGARRQFPPAATA